MEPYYGQAVNTLMSVRSRDTWKERPRERQRERDPQNRERLIERATRETKIHMDTEKQRGRET